MENLVVVSKVKKFIKEKTGLNSSSQFFDKLSDYIRTECESAISKASKAGRKTVMGRDFSIFTQDTTEVDDQQVYVVVSKVKKYIKDKSGLNTSGQAFPVLSTHLEDLCNQAAEQAQSQGRKTVLDRDFNPATDSVQ